MKIFMLLWAALCLFVKYGLVQGKMQPQRSYEVRVTIIPPNGAAVYFLPGGSITFRCLIVDGDTGEYRITDWRISNINVINELGAERVNFKGSELLPFPVGSITTARNVLTILDNFNEFVLTCQLGGVEYAQYHVFLYRQVSLQNFTTTLNVLNGMKNISIKMENANYTASPFPSAFSWTVNSSPAVNSSLVTFGYPSITFHSIVPSLSGLYHLSASNLFTNDQYHIQSSGMGTFMLDVLFAPTLIRGDTQYTVRLGAVVSLLCGTHLQSNPDPIISWRDPRGGLVTASDRFSFINDATGVRLNIINATEADNGTWVCNLTVTAQNLSILPESDILAELDVGHTQYNIDLLVVASDDIDLVHPSTTQSLVPNLLTTSIQLTNPILHSSSFQNEIIVIVAMESSIIVILLITNAISLLYIIMDKRKKTSADSQKEDKDSKLQ